MRYVRTPPYRAVYVHIGLHLKRIKILGEGGGAVKSIKYGKHWSSNFGNYEGKN